MTPRGNPSCRSCLFCNFPVDPVYFVIWLICQNPVCEDGTAAIPNMETNLIMGSVDCHLQGKYLKTQFIQRYLKAKKAIHEDFSSQFIKWGF